MAAKNYLKLIIGYGILKCLIEERVIPNINIKNVINIYLPNEFKDFSLDILNIIQSTKANKPQGNYTLEHHIANRVKIEIGCNKDFNEWIAKELKKIESQINKIEESNEKVAMKKGNQAFLFQRLDE